MTLAIAGPLGLGALTLGLSWWAARSPLLPGDVAVARWLQAHPFPAAHALARVLNALGYAPGAAVLTLALASVLAWRRHPHLAGLALATLPLRLVSSLLKVVVDSPRPTPDLVAVLERASGSGFPSGHAFGAMLLFGLVWWVAPVLSERRGRRWMLRAMAVLAILGIGYSRILVGAHWPSDVIGGYLWGLLTLLVVLRVASRWIDSRRGSASSEDPTVHAA